MLERPGAGMKFAFSPNKNGRDGNRKQPGRHGGRLMRINAVEYGATKAAGFFCNGAGKDPWQAE